MGSSSSKPNLSENELAIERKLKLFYLMKKWYEATVKTPLPSSGDPDLLFQTSRADYYLSFMLSILLNWLVTIMTGISPDDPEWINVQAGVTVDWDEVNNTVSSALAYTTGPDTGEGYSTCVIKSFSGKYYGQACLFKVVVVAVSFNFSASEYETDGDVALFGYWIYFLRADLPFMYDQKISKSTHVEPLADKVLEDMRIVGKRFMTVEELDRFNP